MTEIRFHHIYTFVVIVAVAMVSLGYVKWSQSDTVSRASSIERIEPSHPRATGVSVYHDVRANIVESIEEGHAKKFHLHLVNLKNRLLVVSVSLDELEMHLQRIRVIDRLLENGFFDTDAVAALDAVF